MNDLALFGEKTVTTKELAETLGVTPQTIRDTVEKLGLAKSILQVKVRGQSSFAFNEAQATAIKIELQNHSKVAQNGFNTLSISNDLEAWELQKRLDAYKDRRIAELQAENQSQKKLLEEQAPKVDFYDTVTQSPDTLDMRDVATILNIPKMGRNLIFKILREKRILDGNNRPYQSYINQGYFKVVESESKDIYGGTHVNTKTVVFQKGMDFIKRTIEREA